MAASYNFRTGFNGFNREDVVHYIEYMNSKNTAMVNQLRADLAAQQQEVANLKANPPQDPALVEELNCLKDTVAQLQQEVLSAQAAKAEAEVALADMTRQRDEALASQNTARYNTEAELEAYRRAERMERQAKERTDAMYAKANGIVSEATIKVDDAAKQMGDVANQVAVQLTVLQSAVNDSKQALQDAATALFALQP